MISNTKSIEPTLTMSMLYCEYAEALPLDTLKKRPTPNDISSVAGQAKNPPTPFRIRKRCMRKRPLPNAGTASSHTLCRKQQGKRTCWEHIDTNKSNSDLIQKSWSEERVCCKIWQETASTRWLSECPQDKAPHSPVRRSRNSFDENCFESGKFVGASFFDSAQAA
jgi:hypothetical protein